MLRIQLLFCMMKLRQFDPGFTKLISKKFELDLLAALCHMIRFYRKKDFWKVIARSKRKNIVLL